MNALNQVFLSELASRYDSELQQVLGLSAMARAATCADLQQLLRTHHGERESHVGKLERVFQALDVEVRGAACGITAALLRDCDERPPAARTPPRSMPPSSPARRRSSIRRSPPTAACVSGPCCSAARRPPV